MKLGKRLSVVAARWAGQEQVAKKKKEIMAPLHQNECSKLREHDFTTPLRVNGRRRFVGRVGTQSERVGRLAIAVQCTRTAGKWI